MTRRSWADPTADRARLGELDLLFEHLGPEDATVVLLYLLYGWTVQKISEKLQRNYYEVYRVRQDFLDRFRRDGLHLFNLEEHDAGQALLKRLRDEQDGKVYASPKLRQLLQKCRLIAIAICEHCDQPLPQRTGSLQGYSLGRPRRFCSNGCRQAAYRRRRRIGHEQAEHGHRGQQQPAEPQGALELEGEIGKW